MFFFDRKNSIETAWGHFRSPAADAARAASAAKAAPLGDQDNLPFKLGFTVTTFAFLRCAILALGKWSGFQCAINGQLVWLMMYASRKLLWKGFSSVPGREIRYVRKKKRWLTHQPTIRLGFQNGVSPYHHRRHRDQSGSLGNKRSASTLAAAHLGRHPRRKLKLKALKTVAPHFCTWIHTILLILIVSQSDALPTFNQIFNHIVLSLVLA